MNNSKKIHVLVVDYQEDFLAKTKELLEQVGMVVTTSNNALNTFHYLKSLDIEVIILNADMAVFDGFEVLRQIKHRHPCKQVLVGSDRKLSESERTVFRLIGAFDVLPHDCCEMRLIEKIKAAWVRFHWKEERHRKTHALHRDYSSVAVYDSGYLEER